MKIKEIQPFELQLLAIYNHIIANNSDSDSALTKDILDKELDESFIWEKSKEGHLFWQKINDITN